MYLSKLNITKSGRLFACALIAGAIAAPAAAAVPTTGVDARMPDSRDVATPQVDLRMPDTRDAAQSPTYVQDVQPNVTSSEAGGFDWSTAGISVAAFAGLLIVSIAGTSLVRHRDREAIS